MDRLITIPEPTPEFWAQVLRRWGARYDKGTMAADLPSELRTDLYRRMYSCPSKIYVREEHSREIKLIIRDTRSYFTIDFTKKGIRDNASELQALVADLLQGVWSEQVFVDKKIEIEAYESEETDTLTIQFGVDIGSQTNERWILFEYELCIELVQALMTILEMAKE